MRERVAAALPEPVAELLVSFERSGRAGELAAVSPAVLELTGAAPSSARELLSAQRAALA